VPGVEHHDRGRGGTGTGACRRNEETGGESGGETDHGAMVGAGPVRPTPYPK
jgi:hypothetical protein